jgi:drug/metabolite transporter (DMT)-like permease
VTTVALATAIYGETLGAGQITGGVLVLGAVVLLQVRAAGTVTRDDAPARRSAAPPARTLAHDAA